MQTSQKVCLLFLISIITVAYCDHHNRQEGQDWISFLQELGFISTSTYAPTNKDNAEDFKDRHRNELSSTEPTESSAIPEIMHGYEDDYYQPTSRWVVIGSPIGGIIILMVCCWCCYKCCCARCGKDVVVHSTVIQQPLTQPQQQYAPPTQVVVHNIQQVPQPMAQYPPAYEPPRPHQAWNQFQQQQPPMNQQFSQMPQNFSTPVGEFNPSAPPTYEKY